MSLRTTSIPKSKPLYFCPSVPTEPTTIATEPPPPTQAPPSTGVAHWILVTTGFGDGGALASSEIISLDPSGHPVPDCHKTPHTFPSATWGTVSGLLTDGKIPVVCGGNASADCYGYSYGTDSWSLEGDLPTARFSAGYSAHPSLGIVVTGGSMAAGQTAFFSSVQSAITGSLSAVGFANVPEARLAPCQVTVGDEVVMVFGGQDGFAARTQSAYKLDLR